MKWSGHYFDLLRVRATEKKKRQNLPIQWSRSDGLWFYRSHNMRKIRPSSGQRRKSPSRASDLFSTSIKNSTEIVRQKGMGSSRSSNHGDSIGSNEARQVHWTFARGAKIQIKIHCASSKSRDFRVRQIGFLEKHQGVRHSKITLRIVLPRIGRRWLTNQNEMVVDVNV